MATWNDPLRAWAPIPVVVVCVALVFARLISLEAAAAILAALAAGIAFRNAGRAADPPATGGSGANPPDDRAEDVIEHLPDPVLLLNERREILAANRAAREALGVGKLGRDLALSLRHPDVLAAVETVSAGVDSLTEEITLPLQVPRTFTLHVSRADHRPGRGARVALVFRDETRSKRAEQIRSDFVANAAHELRSPLSAIIGFVETLRAGAAEDSDVRERFLSVMHTESQRLARLVNDLMSLSRVEMNEHVPPREAIDVCDVVDGVVQTLLARAEQKEMSIGVECPPETPLVWGDFDQLTQVLHNLIDNAIKYGRSGTAVGVQIAIVPRLSGDGRTAVSIAVSDRGDGIPAIHLPRLTERFYRADLGRSRRLGGTGLGLAIVKHIVNRHRGRLAIDSTEGVGTTVTVTLPAAAARATEHSSDEPS